MKISKFIFHIFISLICCFAVCNIAYSYTEYQFPEGVVEVPIGTNVLFDEENSTITIIDCPVDIKEEDHFIVYLQDLPIGYIAKEIKSDGNSLIIVAAKADKDIYSLLDEEGDIAITPDMYEFVPAPNVSYFIETDEVWAASDDPFEPAFDKSFKDGILKISLSVGNMSAEVSISNLHLSHSVSDGNIGLALSGDWELKTEQGVSKNLLEDIPLGEMRIAYIGKVSFSLTFDTDINMTCSIGGTFSVGIGMVQGGNGNANKGFTVTKRVVDGQGKISAALKISAGVDVLVASAELYAKIGLDTIYTMKDTFHEADNSEEGEWIRCDDFTTYVYACMGVKAQYFNIEEGKMVAPLDILVGVNEETTPYKVNVHFENGALVDHCTQGMEVQDPLFDSFDVSYTGSGISGLSNRTLETDVELPFDMNVDSDFILANGTLKLNGHTLTVNGDFIQSGGTLDIGSGTLIVQGDYRIQSLKAVINEVQTYGDSDGTLNMTSASGRIRISGDFVICSTSNSHRISGGVIEIAGNMEQLSPEEGNTSFAIGSNCKVLLSDQKKHTIAFDNPDITTLGWLYLENDCIVKNDITVGKAELNGHLFLVNGNYTANGKIDFQEPVSEPEIYSGGDLFLTENMTVQSAFRLRSINLNGYQLTVNGDMISRDDIDIAGGKLTITGSLFQTGGTLYVNGGELLIKVSQILVLYMTAI